MDFSAEPRLDALREQQAIKARPLDRRSRIDLRRLNN
jgi:hypothetical protein